MERFVGTGSMSWCLFPQGDDQDGLGIQVHELQVAG